MRHLARQHRTGLPLEALPTQIREATLEALDDVAVRHGSRTLAVSRVKPGGDVSRLQRWPTALDRSLACHGAPLAKTSVERGEPRTRSPCRPYDQLPAFRAMKEDRH